MRKYLLDRMRLVLRGFTGCATLSFHPLKVFMSELQEVEKELSSPTIPEISSEACYLDDLKNTLEFDRKCRSLVHVFQEVEKHILKMETAYQEFHKIHS